MTGIAGFARARPVLAYFLLTFAFSWGGMLAVVGPGGFPVSTDDSEAIGPFLIVLVGPAFASLTLTGLLCGQGGYRQMAALLTRRTPVRALFAALLPVALLWAAVLATFGLLSDDFSLSIGTTDDRVGLLLGGAAAGFMISALEELGWSGFAIAWLRQSFGTTQTGLIVGIAWGAWHFPMFWESDSFSEPLSLALLLVRLFSWLPALRILMVHAYDRTGGLLAPVAMHAGVATAQVIFEPTSDSDGLMLAHVLVLAAALWCAVLVTWFWNARDAVAGRVGSARR